MSEPQPPSAAPEPAAAPRKSTPPWVMFGFLLLFVGVFWITQMISRGGPAIQWRNDLDQALGEARAGQKRVFLLLQEPNDPTTDGHVRGLLAEKFARDELARMVCCRIVLKPGDPLRARFDFDREPLMLVLENDGKPVARLVGQITELQFRTYVHAKTPK